MSLEVPKNGKNNRPELGFCWLIPRRGSVAAHEILPFGVDRACTPDCSIFLQRSGLDSVPPKIGLFVFAFDSYDSKIPLGFLANSQVMLGPHPTGRGLLLVRDCRSSRIAVGNRVQHTEAGASVPSDRGVARLSIRQ